MSEDLEGVLRRIQKLLAIAGDHRADPNEAAAAARMAERTMRKYQLEHSDVIVAELKRGQGMHSEDCIATAKTNGTRVKMVPPWASMLAVVVGQLMECGGLETYHKDTHEKCIRFYGFKQDVVVAKWIFEYLVATTNRLSVDFMKTGAYLDATSPRSTVASYRRGVTIGIISLIKEEIAARNKEPSTGTSLIVVKRSAIEAEFGEVFKTKKAVVSYRDTGSFGHGVHDGRQVDVKRRGIAGAPAPLAIGKK